MCVCLCVCMNASVCMCAGSEGEETMKNLKKSYSATKALRYHEED